MHTILTLFGTRPEIIKLAPVIGALEARPDTFRSLTVASSQHTDLLYPFAEYFGVAFDYDLRVMQSDQTPLQVLNRVVAGLEPILAEERPDALVVQGDTITTLAGTMAGFYAGIPVAHVEAGLRSGDVTSPFPEEMNRRLVSRMASIHFAATPHNVETLRAEGIDPHRIVLTGNPVVDSLQAVQQRATPSPDLQQRLLGLNGRRIIVLTTHRRESFGEVMVGNLRVLREFVETHADTALMFPVHPNPNVRAAAEDAFADAPNVYLLEPLDYPDFITLLGRAWLVVSDSGGVQEEAPSLGTPLLILRDNTERPEAVESGVARLVGGSPERLRDMLEDAYADGGWVQQVRETPNPFGQGDAAVRIVDALTGYLHGAAAPAVCS